MHRIFLTILLFLGALALSGCGDVLKRGGFDSPPQQYYRVDPPQHYYAPPQYQYYEYPAPTREIYRHEWRRKTPRRDRYYDSRDRYHDHDRRHEERAPKAFKKKGRELCLGGYYETGDRRHCVANGY